MNETVKSAPSKKAKRRTRGHIRKRGEKYYVVYSVAGRKKEEVGGATVEFRHYIKPWSHGLPGFPE